MKWKKPSGLEIETVDDKETVAYCKSLGWEQLPAPKYPPMEPIVAGKRKRRTKAEMEADKAPTQAQAAGGYSNTGDAFPVDTITASGGSSG